MDLVEFGPYDLGLREIPKKSCQGYDVGREQTPPPTVENSGEFLLLSTLRPQNGMSLLSPGAEKCVERCGSSWHQEPSSGGMLKDHYVWWWTVVVAELVGLL